MKTLFEHYTSGESLYHKMVAPVCETYGLTRMEFNVLLFLHHNPQYDTAAQIVKYRRLTKSHVSISIHSLEKRGLLQRAYRGENHRTVHLMLTDQAEDIIDAGCQAQKEFTDVVFAGFTEAEQHMLNDMIERIDRNMECKLNEGKEGE